MNTNEFPRLNTASAIANLGDDPELYGQIVEIFFDDLKGQLADLDAALAANDLPTARRAAHTLKGTTASVGAERLSECCHVLEKACADSDNAAVAAADSGMRSELAHATEALREYLAQAQGS